MFVVHENNFHSSSHPKLAHTTSNLATRFQKSFGPTNIICKKKRESKREREKKRKERGKEREEKKERKKKREREKKRARKKRKWEVKKRKSYVICLHYNFYYVKCAWSNKILLHRTIVFFRTFRTKLRNER